MPDWLTYILTGVGAGAGGGGLVALVYALSKSYEKYRGANDKTAKISHQIRREDRADELAILYRQNEEYRSDLKQVNEKLSKLSNEHMACMGEQAKLEASVEVLQRENQELSRENQDQEIRIAKLESEVSELRRR